MEIIFDASGRFPRLNGEPMERFRPPDEDWCRSFWVHRDAEVLVARDAAGICQAAIEAAVWAELDPEDRPYFTEILAFDPGDNDPRPNGWVAKRFYPDLREVEPWHTTREIAATVPHGDLVVSLWEKYQLSDYGSRQWKYLPDGSPIIHDFGQSDIPKGVDRRPER